MITRSQSRKPVPESRWVSSLPPEMWNIVAEQICIAEDTKSLASLAQVCHAFRDIVYPILYARRIIYADQDEDSSLPRVGKKLPSTLIYTKELEIRLSSELWHARIELKRFSPFLIRVLRMTPNLQTFRWIDNIFDLETPENDLYRHLILSKEGIFSELKKHVRLKHLSLHLTTEIWADQQGTPDLWVDVRKFHNLNSLEIYNIYGKGPLLVDEIAKCLIESPNLKALAIGLALELGRTIAPQSIDLAFNENILEELCHRYRDHYNGRPLALHTLRLGYGVAPLEATGGNEQNYLSKLVKTCGLQVLQIFNGLTLSSDALSQNPQLKPMEVSFPLFEDCEALKSLSLTRLHEEGRSWLNDSRRSTIQELIIEGHSGLDPIVNGLSGKLNLPLLSKLVVYENHDLCPAELAIEPSPNYPTLTYRISRYSIISRLENKGSQLTSLTLTIDLKLQWNDLAARLSDLGSLTEIWLRSCYHGPQSFPASITSLWKDVDDPKDIAYKYAREIAIKCHNLQHIRIGDTAWRVVPSGNKWRVSLRRLDKNAMRKIKAFSFGHFYPLSSAILREPHSNSSSYLRWIMNDD
ncbi:hypothetical protein ACMFMG_001287 [Clarireedia jacksonii]